MNSLNQLTQMKNLSTLIILLFFQSNYAQYTDQINNNRPGQSMGAFAVGKSVFQAESGINFYEENHKLLETTAKGYSADLNIRFGLLLERLETIAEFTYQTDTFTKNNISTNRSALNTATFGAKYLVYDPYKDREDKVDIYSWNANHKFKWSKLIPAVAVYGGVNLNFSDNPFISAAENLQKISPKILIATQNMFDGGMVLVTNIYMDKIGTDYTSLEYIITLTRSFNDKWSGFIENKGVKGDYYSDAIFRTGAAYLMSDDFQIDASITSNIKNTPSIIFGGVGFAWRFDANYKEFRYKKDTPEKSSGSTRGSKPKKEKNRVDEIK